MRKIIICIIFILGLSSVMVFADAEASSISGLKPRLDTTVGKYGYVDSGGGWVIPPKFQEAEEFSEGLAVVRCFDETDYQTTYTAYINSNGEPAFNRRFYRGYSFRNGYAAVTDRDEKVYIIDKNGNTVLKTDAYVYNESSFVSGIRTDISDVPRGRSFTSFKIGYITNDLKLVKPMFTSAPYYYKENGSEEGFPAANVSEYDAAGNETRYVYLLNSRFEPVKLPGNFWIYDIKDGMIRLVSNDNKNYAFADMEGSIIDRIYSSRTKKEHEFVKAESFSDGHAVVGVEDVLTDPYGEPVISYGYINKDGTVFKEPDYLSANSFREGLAAVQPYPSYGYGMGILKADGEYLLTPPIRQEVACADNEKDYLAEHLYSQGEYDFVKAEVKRIVSEVTNGNMSDLEKLDALYKYVIDHANYSTVELKDPTPMGLRYRAEAIGILKGKTVVCDGYTRLLGLLLNEAGIENMYISGEAAAAGSNFYAGHSWNLVKIEGKYYHVDATWDDKDAPNKYFLVSDGYMKESRRWDYTEYPAVPKGYFNDKWQQKE